MARFLFRRLLQMLLVLLIVSFASFVIIKVAPGDILMSYVRPEMSNEDIEELREELGLNGSILSQYRKWGSNILHGNWGYSITNHRSVFKQICEKLPATAALMGTSLLFSLLVAIPLGLWSGVKKNKTADHIISLISYIGISIPNFWVGILLILLFSLTLGWLPASGMHSLNDNSFLDLVRHALMPVFITGMSHVAVFTRYIRSNAIREMGEEYVLTAISKGTPRIRIVFGHVLKNCLLPIITLVGMNLVSLVTGSFIVESVFGWPGLGKLGVSSVTSRDYPVIMGITMLACAVLIVGNFLADILYTVVDPRIQSAIKEARR